MADGDGGEVARLRMLAGERLFTPELGAEICARVAAGRSLMAVGRDAEMPHRTTIRKWANRYPAFAEQLRVAMRSARATRRWSDRELAALKAARPQPVKGGSLSSYTPAVGEAICARIENGQSVVAIVADPMMPCAGTIYGWVKRHPEFEEMYVRARDLQADYFFDEAREVAVGSTHKTVWSDRLRFDTIKWMTARLAPKKYCERLMIEYEIARSNAETTRVMGERGDPVLKFEVVHFRKGPNGEVLVAPPRNAAEEREWREAYGHPYDGPR